MITLLPPILHLSLIHYPSLSALCQKKFATELILVYCAQQQCFHSLKKKHIYSLFNKVNVKGIFFYKNLKFYHQDS